MEFCNDKFINSHGRNPKGYGVWWFGTRDEKWTWYTPNAMTLTDAKKAAALKAREDGIKATIYVLP